MRSRQLDPAVPAGPRPARARQADTPAAKTGDLRRGPLLSRTAPDPGVRGLAAQAAALRQATGDRLARAGHALLQLQRERGNRYVQELVSRVRREVPSSEIQVCLLSACARPVTDDAVAVERIPADDWHNRDNPARPASYGVRGPSMELFRAAASDPSHGLPPAVREQLTQIFSVDFSPVRVHSGEASRAAAASVGARAYTIGRDIYLGAEAAFLSRRDRAALLRHEAMHSAQQGMRSVSPSAGLPVSDPADPAEREAERIGQAITAPAGEHPLFLARMSNQLGATYPPARSAALASPRIQRSIDDKLHVTEGTFDPWLYQHTEEDTDPMIVGMDGTIKFKPDIVGMKGTIEFKPNERAPDSNNIELLQVARVENLKTNQEADWREVEGEGRRNEMRTEEAAGITPGYFVDHPAKEVSPRRSAAAEIISPYYTSYSGKGQPGRKRGNDVKPAWLQDNPKSPHEERFSFETVAVGTDPTTHYYGSMTWGFTINDRDDPDGALIRDEHAEASDEPSATFFSAVTKFHAVYRNPGSRTAQDLQDE